MKEIRRIQTDRVRNMCIRNDYFTLGTNDKYEAMFEMCRKENPSTDDFEKIANVIYWHSSRNELKARYGMSAIEIVKSIMFELINDCTIVHIED